MKYGFVIDHRKCIGCHACTVACKAENDVPLGAFRTWVKYIEKGSFPNTRRYFTIMRCQHCEDAPCVTICPTVALYKRSDGIVDFDKDRCIGCKSCMQACPYDALYIDPVSHTAAKCNYCAHRTDRGLLPACVVVCPEKAIVAGDLDDPTSEIARLVAREHVQIRRPDQGTRPQVFYVGADEAAITPGAATQPAQYMWAQTGPAGVALEPKGHSWSGDAMPRPISITGNGQSKVDTGAGVVDAKIGPGDDVVWQRTDATRARTVYDVAHPKPWGWRVGAYLWTKAVAAGSLAVAGALLLAGQRLDPLLGVAAPLLSMILAAITGGLLIWDLKRPDRFWRIFLTPNFRSWLVIGSYIIALFGLAGLGMFIGGISGSLPLVLGFAIPAIVLGIGTAGYSAFLFGQAEGRDFWQSPMMLWHLLAAALLAGAGSLLLLSVVGVTSAAAVSLLGLFALGLILHLVIVLFDLYSPHSNKDVAEAAALIKNGPFRHRFWGGVIVIGAILPLLLLFLPIGDLGSALGIILALGGLWLYEDTWVMAGQSVAIS